MLSVGQGAALAESVLVALRGCVSRSRLATALEQLVVGCDEAVLAKTLRILGAAPQLQRRLPEPLSSRRWVTQWLAYLGVRQVASVVPRVCREWRALVLEGAAAGALLQPYVELTASWFAAAAPWGLLRHCLSSLETAVLYNSPVAITELCGAAVSAGLASLPYLRRLRVHVVSSWSSASALPTKVVRLLPQVQQLALRGGFCELDGCTELRSLELHCWDLASGALKGLATLSSLTSLALCTQALPPELWTLTRLRSLHLGPALSRVADGDALVGYRGGLERLVQLETLALNCYLHLSLLADVARLPRLTHLALACFDRIDEDQLLTLLPVIGTLRVLALDCCFGGTALLRDLARAPRPSDLLPPALIELCVHTACRPSSNPDLESVRTALVSALPHLSISAFPTSFPFLHPL